MKLGDAIGELCKTLLPIPEECYAGDPRSQTAVCTLASIDLLKQIAASEIMSQVSTAGRLFSENKGIDSMLRHVNSHRNIRTIILCGKDASGHKAGHSLVQLHRHGTDADNRIINSASPEPLLTVTQSEIAHFQNITLVDRIGLTDLGSIRMLVSSLSSASRG